MDYALLDVAIRPQGSTGIGYSKTIEGVAIPGRRVDAPGPYTWDVTVPTDLADGTIFAFKISVFGSATEKPVYGSSVVKNITYNVAKAQQIRGIRKVEGEITLAESTDLTSITVMARMVGTVTDKLKAILRTGSAYTLVEQPLFDTIGAEWAPYTVNLSQLRTLPAGPAKIVLATNTGGGDTSNYYEVAPFPLEAGDDLLKVSENNGSTWTTPTGGENDSLRLFDNGVPTPTTTPTLPPPPVAALTVTQDNVTQEIVLDASGSTGSGQLSYGFTDPDGQIGTNEPTNAVERVPLPPPGSRTYTVTVVDPNNQADTESATITVTAPLPVAKLEVTQEMSGGLTADASGSIGQGLTYSWRVSDKNGNMAAPTPNMILAADGSTLNGRFPLERQTTQGNLTTTEPNVVTFEVTITDSQNHTSVVSVDRQPVHNMVPPVAQGDGYNPPELKWGPPWVDTRGGFRTIAVVHNVGDPVPNLERYLEDGEWVGWTMRVESGDHPSTMGGDRANLMITGGSYNYTGAGFPVSNGDVMGQLITPKVSPAYSGQTYSAPRFTCVEFMLPGGIDVDGIPQNKFNPMLYTGWRHTFDGTGVKMDANGKPTIAGTNPDGTHTWVMETEPGVKAIRVGVPTAGAATTTVTKDGVLLKRASGGEPTPGEPIYVDKGDVHNFIEWHGAAPGSSTIKIGPEGSGKYLALQMAEFRPINGVQTWSPQKSVNLSPLTPYYWNNLIIEIKSRTLEDEIQRNDRGYVRVYGRDPDAPPVLSSYRCLTMGVPSFKDKNGVVTTSSDGKIYMITRKTFIDSRNSEPMGCGDQTYRSPDYEYRSTQVVRHMGIALSIEDLLNRRTPISAVAA